MSDIATGKGEHIFVAIQPDIDTFVKPTTSNTIMVVQPPEFVQEPDIAANEELTFSEAEEPGEFAGYKAGTWSLESYLKLSGSPGVFSNMHPLLYAWYGRFIQNSGVDVRYQHYRLMNPRDPVVYLSVIVKKYFTVEFITGAWVNDGGFKGTSGKIQIINQSGFFLKKVKAGNAKLNEDIDGTSTAVTSIPLKEPEAYKRFDPDSYIVVGTDDNSGEGFLVTAVDKATNTITIEGGVTTVQNEDAEVRGWTPVPGILGENLTTRHGWMNITTGEAGQRKIGITEFDFKVDNGFKANEDEMNDTDYTASASRTGRKVTLNVSRYFRVEDTGFDYDIMEQTVIPFELNIGKEPGRMIQITGTNMRIQKKSESGTAEKKVGLDFKCHPDTGDDESTLILK
ncbi:MAG: hypothetical protein JSV88_25605 [Candidatus Aminicenantes bacterium]|nr:MAG: hypothetical protein JSV88_25605 [Candidatus Aminicenantes bacterium]